MQPRIRSWALSVLVLISFHLHAQNRNDKFLKIGSICPNFYFKNILYFDKINTSVKEFQGKWLILDFWHKYCTTCIESFPETNELQKQFKDKVQFILIGRQDKERQIQELYERVRLKKNLSLPVLFDSTLHNINYISACPFIIVIDDKGIIRAKTIKISGSDIKMLLNGESPKLEIAYAENEPREFNYNYRKPFLVMDNGGNDTNFLFRSVLSKWNTNLPDYRTEPIDAYLKRGLPKFEALGASIIELYRYAYVGFRYWGIDDSLYGRFSLTPILQIKDSSKFESDRSQERNLFSYSIIVPSDKANKIYIQEFMQKDLESYFGFKVSIETRKMPYWSLTADSMGKLKLTGLRDTLLDKKWKPHTMVYVKNKPISFLLGLLWGYHQLEPPFIDETGITGKIYLAEDALLTDLSDIQRALKKNGLILEKKEKDMKVLVIKDKLF